ncbi:MAG: site-2 protease family protein [Oscillospiraceae bacterium]|nr:site-2 protease family protein [Oscillospiraceae bacterium]
MRSLLSGTWTQQDMMQVLVRLIIIMLILPLHEFAHAWTAHKLGDDTASYRGRMTLNPIAHIDPIGALLLLFTGFGWAKPVPIDPTRFNRKHSIRFGVAITALAGPVSNLIAALIGMIGLRIYLISDVYGNYLEALGAGEAVRSTPYIIFLSLMYFVSINIGLALFNLIPVPPLDGSKVVGYFTSAKVDRWFIENQQIVRIVFLVLVFSGLLGRPLGWLSDKVYSFLVLITDWIPKVFG